MKEKYIKPYIEKFYRPKDSFYHYNRDEAEPIIPYFVLDGGAFLFMNDQLKVNNTNDLLDQIMSGEFFEHWVFDGEFQWNGVIENVDSLTGRKTGGEKHLFLQRLYILMPLAVRFYKTGERKYADKFYDILTKYLANHPYYEFDDTKHYMETDFCWRDMQVAWRTIALCISVFFLEKAFDEAKWNFIYKVIEKHADHLLEEAAYHEKKGDAQNHVLQVGAALIYVGCLFPEFKNALEYIRLGKIIVKQNLDGSIFDDGGNNEGSPSYSHFIARLYFDSYMLLENNGYEPIGGVKESTKKQYELLYQMSNSLGQTVTFNDCYVMDAHKDIEIIESVSDIKIDKNKKSVAFDESGFAVLRKGDYEVFVDAMPQRGWHQHSGKPNIQIFFKGEPILVDSGACNYDRRMFRQYLTTAPAHNVVFVEEGVVVEYFSVKDQFTFDEFSDNRIVISGSVKSKDTLINIKRIIEVSEIGVKVIDEAYSDEEYTFGLNMHLPGHHYRNNTNLFELSLGTKVLHVTCPEHTVDLKPCTTYKNQVDYCNVICVRTKGKKYASEFCFEVK